MEGLAQRGHVCFVVTRIDRFSKEGEEKLRLELMDRAIEAVPEPGAVRFRLNGVEILVATTAPSFRAFFVEHKNLFRPDVIITSTDDPAQLLLEAALHDEHAPAVFLTRATVALPFGPDAAFPSREKTEMLRHADGIVGVSNYVAHYIRQHSRIDAIHVPIAPAEPGPHPRVGSFDNPFVTMVNPCAVKGIKIFIELAKAMPEVAFAGVPTWGTTPKDRAMMRQTPNIAILPKVDNINDLLKQSRVLLAPSVWAEARSRIVVEAMLAGVPVMASNLGGLPEAKMGVPYILPVTPIQGYEQRLNEQFVPIAEVPDQDIAPWREALKRLTSDRPHWEEIAQQSRNAALHYAETATVELFEQYLAGVKCHPRNFKHRLVQMPSEQLRKLSPARRRLLELKLRIQKLAPSVNPALPAGGVDPSTYRLFCFPHAGGGAAFFRSWRGPLEIAVEIAPVQYPGRENRRGEPYPRSVEELVESLLVHLLPALTGRFAFFGHSMGAIVAFELMRALRREELPLPCVFIASAARAPQFRRDYRPFKDPSREELIDQVRRLEGLPSDALSNPEMIDLLIPLLEADTALYRRYVYRHEEPFDTSFVAVGGTTDPNVEPAHLEAWKEQTTGYFAWKQIEGGHFYIRSNPKEFFETLRLSTAERRHA